MRIGLISDLHANLVAFDAALDTLARAGVDEVLCLGDVATLGPRPHEVIAKLRELGCTCILGNHDEFLLEPSLIHSYTKVPVVIDAVEWCREQMNASELEFLRGFERVVERDLDGVHLCAFHGTPSSHTMDLLATTPVEVLDDAFRDRSADVYAGGHTHIQMLRQHRGTWLVNPGSVGLPFREYAGGGTPVVLCHAELAVLECARGTATVMLHRVPLDKAKLRNEAVAFDTPLRAMLTAMYA